MDLIITILPVVTKHLSISPRFMPYNFLSRCKFSTLTTRQPMVECIDTKIRVRSAPNVVKLCMESISNLQNVVCGS